MADFINDIIKLARKMRDKERYLRFTHERVSEDRWNYEAAQSPADVAAEVAAMLESLVAVHCIYNPLFSNYTATDSRILARIRAYDHAPRG